MPDPIAAFAGAEARLVDGRQSQHALAIQRGVGRLLVGLGFSVLYELPLASGRRADVAAISANGDIWIVEIKSSVEDFRVDRKWPDYRTHCDRLYFATHAGVPAAIFPESEGLILADGFGAEILREAPEDRIAASTRRAMLLRFAHAAARRFHAMVDPGAADAIGTY